MSENYNAKATMILNGSADLLDDGKIIMMGAKRFNEDFWAAYRKQIAKPIEIIEYSGIKYSGSTIIGKCPECNHTMPITDWSANKILYCSNCGQKMMMLTEVNCNGED